jgi:hypothetical protein
MCYFRSTLHEMDTFVRLKGKLLQKCEKKRIILESSWKCTKWSIDRDFKTN